MEVLYGFVRISDYKFNHNTPSVIHTVTNGRFWFGIIQVNPEYITKYLPATSRSLLIQNITWSWVIKDYPDASNMRIDLTNPPPIYWEWDATGAPCLQCFMICFDSLCFFIFICIFGFLKMFHNYLFSLEVLLIIYSFVSGQFT